MQRTCLFISHGRVWFLPISDFCRLSNLKRHTPELEGGRVESPGRRLSEIGRSRVINLDKDPKDVRV